MVTKYHSHISFEGEKKWKYILRLNNHHLLTEIRKYMYFRPNVLEFLKNLYIVHLVHLDLSVTMSKYSAGKRFMLRTRLKAAKSQRVFSVSFHLQKWLKKNYLLQGHFFLSFCEGETKMKKRFWVFLAFNTYPTRQKNFSNRISTYSAKIKSYMKFTYIVKTNLFFRHLNDT